MRRRISRNQNTGCGVLVTREEYDELKPLPFTCSRAIILTRFLLQSLLSKAVESYRQQVWVQVCEPAAPLHNKFKRKTGQFESNHDTQVAGLCGFFKPWQRSTNQICLSKPTCWCAFSVSLVWSWGSEFERTKEFRPRGEYSNSWSKVKIVTYWQTTVGSLGDAILSTEYRVFRARMWFVEVLRH